MIFSLREPDTTALQWWTMGLSKIMLLECSGILVLFFRGTMVADLQNFGDLVVFSKFSYFYSVVFREILHACCIYCLLNFSILNLCFSIQYFSHLINFSFIKVKNIYF